MFVVIPPSSNWVEQLESILSRLTMTPLRQGHQHEKERCQNPFHKLDSVKALNGLWFFVSFFSGDSDTIASTPLSFKYGISSYSFCSSLYHKLFWDANQIHSRNNLPPLIFSEVPKTRPDSLNRGDSQVFQGSKIPDVASDGATQLVTV